MPTMSAGSLPIAASEVGWKDTVGMAVDEMVTVA
jgi:hypothetical protein